MYDARNIYVMSKGFMPSNCSCAQVDFSPLIHATHIISNGTKDAPPNSKLTSTSVLQLRGNFQSSYDKTILPNGNQSSLLSIWSQLVWITRSNCYVVKMELRFNRPNDRNGCWAKLWIYWWIWPKDISRCFNSESLRGFHIE